MLTVNIIGAGAVGQVLGHLLSKHNAAKIQGVVNRSILSTERAIQFIGDGQTYEFIADLPHADLIMLTVPDQQIEAVAQILALNQHLQPGAIVMHCSGALTSTCLQSLRPKNCTIASLHPAMSFKNPAKSVKQFMNIPCALEGDDAALDSITEVFSAIGASVYLIEPEKKAMYHIAAVFAANYPITLLQQAHACFLNAGLSPSQAKLVIDGLFQTVLENVQQAIEPRYALTGPIQRGDVSTIQEHINALKDDAKIQELYSKLAQETLAISLPGDSIRRDIMDILEDN